MKPGESIFFFMIGFLLLLIIVLIGFLLRKRRKVFIGFTVIVLISFISFYFYYPTLKKNTHAKRYEQIVEYLKDEYPNRKFSVIPEVYEEGYSVGQFDVNDVSSPNIGVTLRVNNGGQVVHTGSWSKYEDLAQDELYRSLEADYYLSYNLDQQIKDISKVDEIIEGSLTIFALDIDGNPALALYDYTKAGYSLLSFVEGEKGHFISRENKDVLYIHVDKDFQEDYILVPIEGGEKLRVDVQGRKGRLIAKSLK